MAPRDYRVAACLAVVGSAVACGDVYEANLGEEPAVSPQRTIRLDAGQSQKSISIISCSYPLGTMY